MPCRNSFDLQVLLNGALSAGKLKAALKKVCKVVFIWKKKSALGSTSNSKESSFYQQPCIRMVSLLGRNKFSVNTVCKSYFYLWNLVINLTWKLTMYVHVIILLPRFQLNFLCTFPWSVHYFQFDPGGLEPCLQTLEVVFRATSWNSQGRKSES